MTTGSGPPAALAAARLHPSDLAGLASIGLRTRKLRATLSALGIAIGVAAIVAVLGLAASAKAALLAEIARLGTNLLTVSNGQTLSGGPAELPVAAPGMIARLPGVTAVQDIGTVSGVNAYKSPLIPPINTNAISVVATTLGLPAVGRHQPRAGPVPERRHRPPAGRGARRRHGAADGHRPDPARDADLDQRQTGSHTGGQWFYVTGILNPAISTPGSTRRSWSASRPPRSTCTPTGTPRRSTSAPATAGTAPWMTLLGAQANPEHPSQVNVSQPSDALTARADAQGALDTLFLGLGAVALLVGAIGVANIMVISVLERRSEIGLRRALGATRGQIRAQFLAEAVLLSLAGGAVGVMAGAAATAVYARGHGEAIAIPPEAWAGGLAAAVIIGALAGLLPAIRAARLSPAQALWTV